MSGTIESKLDQGEVHALCDALLGDALHRKSSVEGLLSERGANDFRVATFRGRLLIDLLLARGAKARCGEVAATDEAGAREIATRACTTRRPAARSRAAPRRAAAPPRRSPRSPRTGLLNFKTKYKHGGQEREKRLFAACTYLTEEKLVARSL